MPELLGFYDYKILGLNEKADYLWENGEFIISSIGLKKRTNLYSLNDFLVEVVYSVHENQIIEISNFKSGHKMNKYLDEISVKDLLNGN